tara:strand:+ start:850 stop:1326 length:477 start_codon:yes stop_codon:yes gene_type:complete
MVLLNKTMMCGGLVILAPGSPLQVLFAILIMMFHLLIVLKLAPYVKDSEDWSAFLSTLGLCLLSLGAYSMMIELDPHQLETIGVVTTLLPLMCIGSVILIMVFVDCGLWHHLYGKWAKNKKKNNATQVEPIDSDRIGENINDREEQDIAALKSWGKKS